MADNFLKTNKIIFTYFSIIYFSFCGISYCQTNLNLVDSVYLALQQSDTALNLKDSLITTNLEVATADHQFSLKFVPLANFGVTSGDSSQMLGFEVTKNFEVGTKMALGLAGNSIENDDFVINNSHNARAYAQLSQPLFRRWGQKYNRLGLTRAEMQRNKQAFLANRTRQEIIQGSIQKYYTAVVARLQKALSEKALSRSAQYLEVAKSRQLVGLVSKTDVYRAELASLSAESAVLDQRRSLETAEDALKENLSWDADWDLALNEDISLLAPVLPEDWRAILPEQRSDWQAQLVELDLSGILSFRAERDLLPDLFLNLQVEQKGQGESYDEAGQLDETNWSVQLQLNSTFDSFNEQAALTREKMAESKLRRNAKALERRIFREARQAFQDLLSADRRLEISRKSLEQAEKALDLALIRYERGLSDNVELLDAEEAFAAAELNIIQDRVTYNLSAVRVAYALGVLDLEWLQLSLPNNQSQVTFSR